jgi:dTDP-4-amino-4,6-dideoxygalactose transaminase
MSANVPVTLDAPALDAYAPELPPLFAEPLHVGAPNIGDRTRFFARLNDILDRKWLTNQGPYVTELERRIAKFLGVKHCIATSNGTVALDIAARATGMSGEVIVPAFTFIATAHALQWQGITPVFCDVDPVTHNVSPASVEEKITPRTSGIFAVHLWGRPAPIEELARRKAGWSDPSATPRSSASTPRRCSTRSRAARS